MIVFILSLSLSLFLVPVSNAADCDARSEFTFSYSVFYSDGCERDEPFAKLVINKHMPNSISSFQESITMIDGSQLMMQKCLQLSTTSDITRTFVWSILEETSANCCWGIYNVFVTPIVTNTGNAEININFCPIANNFMIEGDNFQFCGVNEGSYDVLKTAPVVFLKNGNIPENQPEPANCSMMSLSLTKSTSSPTPTTIVMRPHCPGDGSIWFDTPGDSNATGTCYRGTVNATRYCRESGVWDNVKCHTSPVFDAILSQTLLNESLRLLKAANDIPLNQRLYLFDIIIANRQMLRDNIELALTIANDIFNSGQKELRNSIITQLLLTLDTLALNSLETNLTLSFYNMFLRMQEVVFPLAGDKIVGINVESNSIQLPSDISFTMNDTIKIVSFVFRNLSQLLSPQTNKRRLISPVVSATCINCKKTDINPQVNISFNLSSQEISPNDALICVFLNISESNDSLPTSDWSTEGCKQSSYQKENSIITCQCDHLTHFAILISPRAPDGDVHDDILTVVGYVLTPISLVCMLLVIFTYACMKSLWNMRNYIHIMLCINLFIAQLLFVVGIERTVYLPVCSVIAVILQYMYLVSFMWMLMEGVVLYVTLVRVFIKHPKRYIASFTISSYGIPALYMMIVIPIGFLAGGDHTYYLYYNSNTTDNRQTNYSVFTTINEDNNDVVACWLDYESGFVFTFIVPVIVIILANCGFFIMSIVIIWRQLKKQNDNSNISSIKHWLKVSISLTIVMGIGWIFNVLFFARELLFVAYISTIFIAGQGIVIFIMYVPLSKQVRSSYTNWFHKKQANSTLLSKFSFETSSSQKHTNNKESKDSLQKLSTEEKSQASITIDDDHTAPSSSNDN